MKAALATIIFTLAGLALAAEPFEGRWGSDAKSCRVEPIFTLTPHTIDSPTFGCRQVLYTPAGDRWSARARQCYSEGEEGATSMTFAVVVQQGKLRIDWGKEGQSDWLVRCGK